MAFQCSSTQLNVVNWVLRRGSAHAQTSSQLKSHKYFQGYQEPLQSYRRDHKSPSGLSGASSECNFMEKGKSADVGGKKPDEASRSLIVAGKDTGSIELSKASLEAIAEIVASKLRVDPLRASAEASEASSSKGTDPPTHAVTHPCPYQLTCTHPSYTTRSPFSVTRVTVSSNMAKGPESHG